MRRRLRAPARPAGAARLLLGLALAAGPLVAASPADAARAVATAPEPIAVDITAIDPVAPQPHTTMTITARVTNRGPAPLDTYDAELRLGYHPIGSRSELAVAAADQTHFASDVPAGARWDSSTPLLPGASQTVQLTFPVDEVGPHGAQPMLTAYGVYQLGVEVHQDPQASNAVVGLSNTFLPWLPASGWDGTGWSRLKVAWLWPFSERPQLGPTGTLSSSRLASDVAPGGRLAELLAEATQAGSQHGTVALPVPQSRPATEPHKGRRAKPAPPGPSLTRRSVPVTYAIDPALVEALATLAASSASGHERAGAYLSDLRSLVRSDNLVSLPYGDPDISALIRAGAYDQLRSADTAGDAVLARNNFPKAVLGVSWPPTGYLSQSALQALTSPYVVLSGGALPLAAEMPYTPTGVAQLPRTAGPVTALLSDDVLDSLATSRVTADSAALVEQRFAAETALIVAERPHLQRLLVVAPPHLFEPTNTAAGTLLADSGLLPWLEPVSISEAVDARPDPAAVRPGLRYPATARDAELPPAYVDATLTAAHGVHDLRDMLCPPAGSADQGAARCQPDQLALPVEHALLAVSSASWRDDLAAGRRLLDATDAQVHHYLDKVHITTAGTVTLVSQSGSIPITIANDLSLPVTVRLDITTPNRAQLRVSSHKLFVVAPGAKTQQTIQAHTASAGKTKFPIYVQLETPDGSPLGAPTELVVRSSAYGAVAVAITAGALAVLFGTVAVRLTRSALRARRRPAEPAGD